MRQGSSPGSSEDALAFGPGRNRTPAERGRDSRIAVRAIRRPPRTAVEKREARPSLNYTKRGFRLRDGRLHLAGGIVLRVVWSRDLPADASSVRVYQDTLGHWYVSFVVAAQSEPLAATGRVLGVDWGVKETATTTDDAYDLPHAEHGR
ncbi:RNA-guided endonuclease TnpB family protein, partial [Streptomyces sp. NPDC003998]